MDIEQVPIEQLKPAEYNPRKVSPEDFEQIKKSIEKFGFVQPLVCNNAPGREGIVIGGNQRLEVAKKIGMKEVPVYWVDILDLEREKELNIRLNRNQADWDWEAIHNNFDFKNLLDWGFEKWEIPEYAPQNNVSDEDVTKDRMKIYSNNPIRQVVLYFSEEDFDKIVTRMNELCQEKTIENYSDLIWFYIFGEKNAKVETPKK